MVEPGPKAGGPSALKMILNLPVAASYSSVKLKELASNLEKIQTGIAAGNLVVDTLFDRINGVLSDFSKDGSRSDFKDTQARLLDFTKTILDQYKKRKSEEIGNRLIEAEKTIQLEKESLIKAIESYLALDPDLFSLTRISLKWNEGHYEGRAIYEGHIDRKICEKGARMLWKMLGRDDASVNFEFSLKTSAVELFAKILRSGDLKKGLKLPIGSAVGWASKEAVINFEKMDKYYVSSVEMRDSNAKITLSIDETKSDFIISYSDNSESSVLGLTYKDEAQEIDLMANSVLANNVDAASLKEISKIITDSLRMLVTYKARLVSLVALETDIIATLDAPTFLKACASIYHCMHVKGDGTRNSGSPPIDVTKDYIKERLQMLGKDADDYSELLGIS